MNDANQEIDPGILEMFGATNTTETTPETQPQPEVSEQPAETTQADMQEQSAVPENVEESKPQEGTASTKDLSENDIDDIEDRMFRGNTKQNKAFAELRMQNKAQAEFIIRLARSAGLNPKDVKEAQEFLSEGATRVEAKKRNIDPETLRQLEEERTELEEYRNQANRQAAMLGFQKVKNEYNLTNEDLNNFAEQLAAKNINPFSGDRVDLLKEYRMLNFDKLLAQAKEAGRQEEIARSLKAKQNSTTPLKTTGNDTPLGETPAVNTVKDLDNLLNSLNKK